MRNNISRRKYGIITLIFVINATIFVLVHTYFDVPSSFRFEFRIDHVNMISNINNDSKEISYFALVIILASLISTIVINLFWMIYTIRFAISSFRKRFELLSEKLNRRQRN